ncbi:helix-turn-helix transcriptional regulator [Colwellia sp. E2M01]|uniref:helix-turn-helix domain-containing protein n=1 Tax=Colwellia sp. E2M01 TaxID=2841561 RepID=UPI001C09FEB9|nr:helix-turn-helix transcriptional regulator [Colwellia sp. E2M01]MBU2872085.1 helix-turn-helix transcriptional regulator [Colwellia sp. E2M01]
MSKEQVYCEPFCIEEGYQFEIHKVKYDQASSYSCFMHFHEVHELILFEQIEGKYFYSQGESELQNNDIVYTPALETHDFKLNQQQKSWYIIQFIPELFNDVELKKIAGKFERGQHLRLKGEHLAIVQSQVKWLHQSYLENPLSGISLTLLRLLILWIAEHANQVNPPNTLPIYSSVGYQKIAPVIDLFRQNSSVELTLVEAAEKCFMSPSHFSRLFKSIFRCNYSEYSLRHKLYSAARLISQTDRSITDISFDLYFSSPSHFISQFKKQFKVTPFNYRKNLKKRAETTSQT